MYGFLDRDYPDLWQDPLAIACFYKLTEVALLMLDSENELKVHSSTGRALVKLATIAGLEAVLRRLISRGAQVNLVDINRRTLLHCAVAHQNERIVDLLLESGANVNISEHGKCIRWAFSPLEQAIKCGNASLINRLLDAGAHVTEHVMTAAAEAEDDSITKRLVAHDPLARIPTRICRWIRISRKYDIYDTHVTCAFETSTQMRRNRFRFGFDGARAQTRTVALGSSSYRSGCNWLMRRASLQNWTCSETEVIPEVWSSHWNYRTYGEYDLVVAVYT